MSNRSNGSPVSPLVDIRAIKACLDELGDHAAANGLLLAANLIGAASGAIADEIVERKAKKQIVATASQGICNS